MPTRNVNLTDALDKFVGDKIEGGHYENASEVVRAALRLLQREEEREAAKLDRLRSMLDEGELSGIAKDYTIESLLEELDREFDARDSRKASASRRGKKFG